MIVDFDVYYREYLGCRTFDDIYVRSLYRDMPINANYYYPFVRSSYKSKVITSVSSQIYHNDYRYLSDKDICDLSLDELNRIYPSVQYKEFYRYSTDDKLVCDCCSACILKDEYKEFFMRSGKNTDPVFKENKWLKLKKYIEEENMFVSVFDNKIVSTCKISDIYCGGANLYVHTDEVYRNKGFGKDVVSLAINTCIERGIRPIYFVEKGNISSQKLAESLGFKLKAKEYCFCIVK